MEAVSMHKIRMTVFSMWCALMVLASMQGCSPNFNWLEARSQEADQALFDAKLAEARASGKSGLPEKAQWFRSYYRQLVHVKTEDHFLIVPFIMIQHGRWHAIQQLEPLLNTEKGECLKRSAALLYVFSFRLHPDAERILRNLDQHDPLVRGALIGHSEPAEYDEDARMAAHVPVQVWRTLTKREKWDKLRAVLPSRSAAEDLD